MYVIVGRLFFRLMITESHTNLSTLQKYYGEGLHPGAQVPLNFGFIESIDFNNIINSVDQSIRNWMEITPHNGVANWMVRIYYIEKMNICICTK